MSTYWDLVCVTCDAKCGFHWNHGDQQLTALWQLREEAADAALFFERFHQAPALNSATVEFRIYSPETSPGVDFFDWMIVHRKHDVRVRNEYGRDMGTCGKWMNCSSCDGHPHCKLKIDHVGACSSIDPDA